jgi:hypothetical protein
MLGFASTARANNVPAKKTDQRFEISREFDGASEMTYAAEEIKQARVRGIDSLMTRTSQHIFTFSSATALLTSVHEKVTTEHKTLNSVHFR